MKRGTPVWVIGGDYKYKGRVVTAFKKLRTKEIRYIIQDRNRRLFIHNEKQLRACASS